MNEKLKCTCRKQKTGNLGLMSVPRMLRSNQGIRLVYLWRKKQTHLTVDKIALLYLQATVLRSDPQKQTCIYLKPQHFLEAIFFLRAREFLVKDATLQLQTDLSTTSLFILLNVKPKSTSLQAAYTSCFGRGVLFLTCILSWPRQAVCYVLSEQTHNQL